MRSSAWAQLLRHIPADQHDSLMLVTAGRTEIAIQSILRIDHEFLAIKGRLAGSQDSGRIFFLPFSHIDYLGFQKSVKEEEFQAMFGNLQIAAPPVGPEAAVPTAPGNGGPVPIKSHVLERYRSRASSPGLVNRPPLEG